MKYSRSRPISTRIALILSFFTPITAYPADTPTAQMSPLGTSVVSIPGATSRPPLFRFNSLIQAWSISNVASIPNSQGTRLRRAEFKGSGQITTQLKYFAMIDPSRLILQPGQPQSSIRTDMMIQDFGVGYSPLPGFELTVGQYKMPTSPEGLDSSSELLLPERSLISRTIGDRREMGVKAAYRQKDWNVTLMISDARPIHVNGEGLANSWITRAEWTQIKGLILGGFVNNGLNDRLANRSSFGFNARLTLAKWSIQSEWADFKLIGRSNRILEGQGMTHEISYWATDTIQPVFRFEALDPNLMNPLIGSAQTLGLNYYLRKLKTKLQLAGSLLKNMSAPNGSPRLATTSDQNLTLAVQLAI